MAKIQIVYSTIDGHTVEICDRIQAQLSGAGNEVSIVELTDASSIDLQPFDAVLIGASIRYGKHRPNVAAFIDDNADTLRSKPSAFFSVNAVARKPEKRGPDTNPYVIKFLRAISWKPPLVGVFGGKIDYPKYGVVDRTAIRFIMWMTKGPTDPTGTFEFTDWDEVEAFAQRFAELVSIGSETREG